MSQPMALRKMHATGNGRGPKVGWAGKPSMMLDKMLSFSVQPTSTSLFRNVVMESSGKDHGASYSAVFETLASTVYARMEMPLLHRGTQTSSPMAGLNWACGLQSLSFSLHCGKKVAEGRMRGRPPART